MLRTVCGGRCKTCGGTPRNTILCDELPAGIYTIKISDQSADTANDVTVTAKAIATGATAPTSTDVGNLEKELDNSIPSYKATRTKSKKWKDGKPSPINAIDTVGEDG